MFYKTRTQILIGAILLYVASLAVGAEPAVVNVPISVTVARPFVVFIHVDWCQPCQTMKAVMADPKVRDALRGCEYYKCNMDQEPEVARGHTKGGGIPQLVWYESRMGMPKRRRLIGAWPVERVVSFIQGK